MVGGEANQVLSFSTAAVQVMEMMHSVVKTLRPSVFIGIIQVLPCSRWNHGQLMGMNEKPIKRKKKGSAVPAGHGRVRLELADHRAQKVFVAGTFNNWEPISTALVSEGEGRWAVELALPPGQYEYRFIVDEQWMDDPRATEFVPNIHGGINCIFTVTAEGQA